MGYELLYRGRTGNAANIVDQDAATRSVLFDAIKTFGIPNLTNHLPAYIKFTRNLILNDFGLPTNPNEIAIEISENTRIDEDLRVKLLELRQAGYMLVLDDYRGRTAIEKFINLFDVIRINLNSGNNIKHRESVEKLWRAHLQLLAGRIETLEDFVMARQLNFDLFQGYFFEKPTRLSKEIPSFSESSYGRLMNELLKPSVNFITCCSIIQNDVILTYMLKRRVHTNRHYHGNVTSEIMDRLVIMGTEELRRWVCLVFLKQSNITHSDEVAKSVYLRGHFIESLIENSDTNLSPSQGFLMGMFSLMDKLTGVSLNTLLKDLALEPHVKAALLGYEENEYTLFLQYVILYEMENARLILPDIHLNITDEEVALLYTSCIIDTDAAFSQMEGS